MDRPITGFPRSGDGFTSSETVIKKTKTKTTITTKTRNVKLWEIGVCALFGAAIYYTPLVIKAFTPGERIREVVESVGFPEWGYTQEELDRWNLAKESSGDWWEHLW